MYGDIINQDVDNTRVHKRLNCFFNGANISDSMKHLHFAVTIIVANIAISDYLANLAHIIILCICFSVNIFANTYIYSIKIGVCKKQHADY